MDRSSEFFGELEEYNKIIKDLIGQEEVDEEALWQAQENKRRYIVSGMDRALFKEGYSLLVEDVAKFLDIDEKQVRGNIIPHVDHIMAPEGSADFFNIEDTPQMKFLDMRIKRWKRLFIKADSFQDFLEKHLVIYCPYTKLTWSEEQQRLVADGEGETPIPYPRGMEAKLVKKSNISSIIRQRKIADLVRKTKNDITHARLLDQITAERLKDEMEYLSEASRTLDVTVHTQEVLVYIKKTNHYRLHLYKEEGDKNKPLYCTTRKKTEDVEWVKPTVLYWFL